MALRGGLLHRRSSLLRILPSDPGRSLFARTILTDHTPNTAATGGGNHGERSDNSFESAEDFERRLFSSLDEGPNGNSFYKKLDKLERNRGRFSFGSKTNDGGDYNPMDGLGGLHTTLSDGLDDKLKQTARTFEYSDEIYDDNYKFRPDMTFAPGTTYTTKDLDLTKPAVQKSFKRSGFETTTQEVLKKADFRNVRFLANFLTEAGIIIKRSQTKISAKAQRKIAREIKTARAFGLMPFTTMGTKPFVFGKNMKDEDEDYEYDDYSGPATEPVEEG